MSYPEPTLTETNRPLIEAWGRGELVLQHCAPCGHIIFFPRELCPKCWSTQLEWRKHSGRGRVVSHSRVYSHVTEPFASESPVTLAEIELEDGGAMLARVIESVISAQAESLPPVIPAQAGIQKAEIAPGAAVELVPMPDAARYSLPTFKLA